MKQFDNVEGFADHTISSIQAKINQLKKVYAREEIIKDLQYIIDELNDEIERGL